MGLLSQNPQPTKPTLKLSPKAQDLKVQADAAKVTAQKSNSFLGLVKNTILGIPKAVVDTGKDLAKGSIEFAQSTGEAIPRVISGVGGLTGLSSGKISRAVVPPVNVPGIGPVQSFQSQANQKVNEGKSSLRAIGEATFDTVANDPVGISLKPLALAAKPLIAFGGLIRPTEDAIQTLAKSTDLGHISSVLKEIGVQDDLIPTVAKKISTVSDPATVKKGLDSISELQKTSHSEKVVDKTTSIANSANQDVNISSDKPNLSLSESLQMQKKEQPSLQSFAQETSNKESSTIGIPRELESSIKTPNQTPQIEQRSPLESSINNSYTNEDKFTNKDFNPDEYVKEQVTKREDARGIEQNGLLAKTKSFLQDVKSKLIDFTAPIEDTLNAATKANDIKLKPSEDIHNQIDRVLRAPSIAGQFAKDNGLVNTIQNVDDIDKLDQYLTAKHGQDLEAKGIVTGRNSKKDRALIENYSSQYEPFAKQINNYSQKLLDYSVESGLISKELAETLKKRYPNYVPFNRVFSEIEKKDGFGTKAVASLSSQNIIKNIEGSTREVESPIESLLSKTNDAFQQGEKNKAAKMLAGYKDLPGNPFELKELPKGETAPHTISYLDNGEKKVFQTTKEIAQAAKSLNVEQLNILGKILAFPVRIARLGITGINLPFVGANLAKDQITSIINTDHVLRTSILNPKNFLSSLFAAVGHGELYQEVLRAGGGGTSYDIARGQIPQTIKEIQAGKSAYSKILYTVTRPQQWLKTIENVVSKAEETTRIQQYKGTKEGLMAQGMDEKEATIAAARAARETTVNFMRRGEWGTVLNSAFLYLNAGIQGNRALLRNLKDKPLATSAKIAVSTFFPMAAVTAWNLNDPKRAEIYKDIREYEKKGNLIIIPPDPVKDENGDWNIIKIPIPQEVNNFVDLVRKPIEQAYGLDPVKFSDVANSLIGTVSPVSPDTGSILSTLTPQIIRPTLEGVSNHNFYAGTPQVPPNLQKLSPENQVKSTTSGTAREIGKVSGFSPIKIEQFIKGTLGGVGSQIINRLDTAQASLGIIPPEQVGGENPLIGISDRFTKASGGALMDKQFEELNKVNQSAADTSKQVKDQAHIEWDKISELGTKEEKKAYLKNIASTDPDLAKKIIEVGTDAKKGLTAYESSLKSSPVVSRAQIIAQELNKLQDSQAKKDLLKDYVKKGIVTEDVLAEVIKIRNSKK